LGIAGMAWPLLSFFPATAPYAELVTGALGGIAAIKHKETGE